MFKVYALDSSSHPFISVCICSQKHQSYARAHIDFKKPDDVIEFAEFFDGHVFVNEKGNASLHA